MDADQPSEIIKSNTPQDPTPHLEPWQVGILSLVIILSVAFVWFRFASSKAPNGDHPTGTPSTATAIFPAVVHGPPTSTPTATSTATPTPTPTPTPIVIISRIEALGRLETTKYVVQTVVDLEKEPSNRFTGIFGTDKILLIAAGEVVAGFDLKKVKEDDIIVSGLTVTMTLPPPEIFSTRVDNEKTYVYERETGVLQKPDQDLETEARQMAEQRLTQWATDNEILSQAETFGIVILESFLRSFGFTEVHIGVTSAN